MYGSGMCVVEGGSVAAALKEPLQTLDGTLEEVLGMQAAKEKAIAAARARKNEDESGKKKRKKA